MADLVLDLQRRWGRRRRHALCVTHDERIASRRSQVIALQRDAAAE
jgi:hypothetical protein